MEQKRNIFWFRRDLRLHDNRGLLEACNEGLPVTCLFIFDTEILREFPNPNDRRLTFIFQTLQQIQEKLKPLGGGITVCHGKPIDVFNDLSKTFNIKTVFANADFEMSSVRRDQDVAISLQKKGIGFRSYTDHLIFEPDEIKSKEEKSYSIFTPYMKRWKEHYKQKEKIYYPSEQKLHNIVGAFGEFPSPDMIGYQIQKHTFPAPIFNASLIQNYHHTRDYPYLEGTSRLGIHFRFGTISIREAVQFAFVNNEIWLNELIWREFFIQVMFNFPHAENGSFKKKYDLFPWKNNEKQFERWCAGETGFPIIDAGIRELLQTGFMHNRVRMITANFLTKLLLIDWHWGERFFATHLLDYEKASNVGNWQWAAGCGADAAPYFRIFNPDEQIRKFDPQRQYITKWLSLHEVVENHPMIQYKESRLESLERFKNFLQKI